MAVQGPTGIRGEVLASPTPLSLGRCRQLLDRALAPVERDDRFDGPAPEAGSPYLAATLDHPDGSLLGFLGGPRSRGRLQLDAVIDDTRLDPVTALHQLWETIAPRIPELEPSTVELWGRPARWWHQRVAANLGFTPERALHQMRCRLPVALEPVPSRPYDPTADAEALLRVNNRAFAGHPDQGRLTLDDLAEAASQPWFRADGIRLHREGDELVGFCWTKIHPARSPDHPGLGEIYVIAVDPDHHGRGLGAPMTAAGLSWLADRGLTVGMLYVEADNAPAVATYRRLGFGVVRTDRAWTLPADRVGTAG